MKQLVLADQLQGLIEDQARAAVAETIYRCKVGQINCLTRLAYAISVRIHGPSRASDLFVTFLLHAKHKENADYIQRLIEQAVHSLRAGRLSTTQCYSIRQCVEGFAH